MELQKIYTDSDFSNAVIPEGSILTYLAQDEDGNIVTKTKNSSGEIGVITGGESGESVIPGYFINNANGTLSFQPIGGTAETVSQVSIVNTGVAEPDYSAVVVGTDTSDATATAEDIAEGKTAYIASGKATGTAVFSSSMDFYKCASISGTPVIVSPTEATSNTGDGYILSASTVYNSSYEPWKAFSGAAVGWSVGWLGSGADKSPWIQIQFTEAKTVTSYQFSSFWDADQQINFWTLQGSNDGETWTTVDKREGQVLNSESPTFSGDTANPGSYTHYRLNIGSSVAVDYLGVQGVVLYQQSEEAKFWTGYKAVLTDGVYSFEETTTTGLTYGKAYTPKQNSIYNADATVRISGLWDGIPKDDLIFHASLSKRSDVSDSGQQLAYTGTVSFVTSEDRKCARIEGQNNFIHVKPENDPYGRYNINNKFTLAAWIRPTDPENRSAFITFSGGQCGTYSTSTSLVNEVWLSCKKTVSLSDGSPNYTMITTNIDGYVWRHMTATWDGTKFELYVDGVFAGSYVGHGHSFTNYLYLYINSLERAPEAVSGYGEYADVYLYDRVLSPEEISELYNGTLF